MNLEHEVQEITSLMKLYEHIHHKNHDQRTYEMYVSEYTSRMEDFTKRHKRESPFYNNLRWKNDQTNVVWLLHWIVNKTIFY